MRRLDLAFAVLELLARAPAHAAQGAVMTLRNIKSDVDQLVERREDTSLKSTAQVVAAAVPNVDPLDDRAPNVAMN